MDFNEEVNCETCKYGYYNGVSDDMEHNLCGTSIYRRQLGFRVIKIKF